MITKKQIRRRRAKYLANLHNVGRLIPEPITDDNTGSELISQLSNFQKGLTTTLFSVLSSYGQNKEGTLTLPLNWHQPRQWITINLEQISLVFSDQKLSWFQHNEFVDFYTSLRQLTQLVQNHFQRSKREKHLNPNEYQKNLAMDWLYNKLQRPAQDHPYQLDSQHRELNLTHLERTFYAEFAPPKDQYIDGSLSELVVKPSIVILRPAYLSAIQLFNEEIKLERCQFDQCQNLIAKVQAAKFCDQCSHIRKKESDSVIDLEKVLIQVKVLTKYASSGTSVFADQIADDFVQTAPKLFSSSTSAQNVAQWLNKNRRLLSDKYQITYTSATDSLMKTKVYTFYRK